MKFSENTLAILNNFSDIKRIETDDRSSIVLKPGNTLSIITHGSTVMAYANIDEEIPQEFGIYELPVFMSNIQQFGRTDAEIEFKGNHITISSADASLDFYGAAPQLIKHPSGSIKQAEYQVSFRLENSKLERALKIAALNKFDTLSFKGDGTDLSIVILDRGQITQNYANLKIGETDKVFEASFNVKFLKFLPLDYTVEISDMGFGRFTSADERISYYVLLQKG